MRKTLLAAAVLVAACAPSSWAMKIAVQDQVGSDWEALLQYDLLGAGGGPIASHEDTVYFGGSGSGNGSVVRNGNWNWENASAETPIFFPDGDPVGNQYRDGWQFQDRTTRNGPSANGAGHWSPTGVYDFNNDNGAYAHRATVHDSINFIGNIGPGPLQGSWSIWIGTNLYLNPENCGWGKRGGYGDGWSQGIRKTYPIPAGSNGDVYTVRFFHRFACEAGFDTCVVEWSYNDLDWFFADPSAIFNGGDGNAPLPTPAGGPAVSNLTTISIPGNVAGNLHVRFRLKADAFLSDNNEGGFFFYAWQLDNIQVFDGAVPVDPTPASFEDGLDGWQLARFEGFDAFETNSTTLPAGRIASSVACPPIVDCPETCGIQSRFLIFTDAQDCNLGDFFQDTYATSPAIAINAPDINQDGGRLIVSDVFLDGGGANAFDTGPAFCFVYFPYNAKWCPFTPAAGRPGAGITFNWSQTGFTSCNFFAQGVGTACADDLKLDVSEGIPADADSVILHIGAFSQCRSNPVCDINDNGAPFFDNIRFGVYNPAGLTLGTSGAERYSDNFPTANGPFATQTTRSDGAHSFSMNLDAEVPNRWVRADSAATRTGASNVSIHLRWRVTPGTCQPNLNHLFFQTFPANQWHSARMDTGHAQGTGAALAGTYMTCFHPSDPRNNTFWTPLPAICNGVPQNCIEPCDDILPDALFTAGTVVHYFFEARNAANGTVLGTFPRALDGRPIGTTDNWKSFWLEMTNLPALDANCVQANNLLIINDQDTRTVLQRSRLTATLASLGLEFDIYDCVGTEFVASYNGIGRREDHPAQQPRPPFNGATDQQLGGYDCIWYTAGTSEAGTLSDSESEPLNGGHASRDQQSLETWIETCTAGENRLLIMEGSGWAVDVDVNTDHGPTFLSRFGIDVLNFDYAHRWAEPLDDNRRCARITRTLGNAPVPPQFDRGELFGSGCNDDLNYQVLGAVAGGQAVANYVQTQEGTNDPINCADDANKPAWHAVIRKADGAEPCEKSVAMSFPFALMSPLNCVDECLLNDFVINGENAQLVIEMFNWAGKDIADNPIGVPDPPGAPRLVNALYQAQPNPANPSARIRYTIAEKGPVALKIFDVSGRLVRTLVDQVQEPAEAGFEVVWDGMNDGGQRVGSGVFFYQIEAPGWSSSKKLVILK